MKIKWLGHSCFLLTTGSGAVLITDPYDVEAYPGTLLYDPIDETADVVTISHQHPDHNNVEAVGGTPIIVSTPNSHSEAGFSIFGVASYHDKVAGAQRGDNLVFSISADSFNICHLGDLGQVLSAEQVEAIGPVDVLMIPVGGTFTIDAAAATRVWQQLSPPLTIPMHFRNSKCRFQIAGVDEFLAGKPSVERAGASEIEVEKENLSAGPKIVVLEPAK
ncbi:MAG: MBL fold metallo-hydrolase [Thermoleophilia bacterium]|nr:MBL fold metallo-hydrolase [Thermoleophilia bacterium]